ncbi:MAG TPA: tetratricopeptide repeat protein [Tepidisphaeraceae bacterium]|jgi:tetratricopeptide (TPR) repeat protein|nr:tetratricopeptide repeat protein [Tepidisphaeraceae bacterium]
MKIRDKTRRRLLLILIPALSIAVIVAGAAAVRLAYLRRTAQRGKADGLAAMTAGDYPTALKDLGKYLSRNPNDVDILLQYAQARRKVVEPDGSHLGQAIGLYRRALELGANLPASQRAEAQRDLLDLYIQVHFNTEAIALADEIASHPSSAAASDASADVPHALRCKIIALMQLQRFEDAQTTLASLAKQLPLDLEIRILQMQIMLKKGDTKGVVVYAKQLSIQHPNDPRFELLKSIAAALVGDRAGATGFAMPLVNRPVVDPVYTSMLIRQLDSLQLFDASFKVIQQAAKTSSDRGLKRLWLRRMFETEQFAALVDQTADLDPKSSNSDLEILALRVWALSKLNRTSDAGQLIADLNRRGQAEPSAAKWAAALRATVLHESVDPVKTIAALRDALSVSPSNPILLNDLGDAYADAAAHDKASMAWVEATRAAPEWASPFVKTSQSLLAGGRNADALASAKAAAARAPNDHDAVVSVVAATAANLPAGASPDAADLLTTISAIQKKFPNDRLLLPIQVRVLVKEQKLADAKDVIQKALALAPAPPERILLALARISEVSALNQEEACWAACEKAHGFSLEIAFARATWLYGHNRGPEGLALLQQAQASHPGQDVSWKIAWARYLDLSSDPRAKDEWIALGDAHPQDVKLQWGAASAKSVQSDHRFVGRTIDRLVALLGDDSISLRLLRARWDLQAGKDEATQAAIILGDVIRKSPEMAEPHLLLATYYTKIGDVASAVNQLAAASDAQPDIAGLAIEVAEQFHSRGDPVRSRQYIDRACRSKTLDIATMRRAAALLALQGDYSQALLELQRVYPKDKPLPPDLMLASLYRRLDQPDKTAEICHRLMEKPTAPFVSFAADFYASQGHMGEANSALETLSSLKLPPGVKESILGNFAERHGVPDGALKHFRTAAEAAPKEAAVWQQLVGYYFGKGMIDEGLAAAEEASGNLASPGQFAVLQQNAALIKAAGKLVSARPLLMALVADSSANAPVLEAIRDVVAATQQKELPKETAAKLRRLADDNPHVLALQMVALELFIDSGQTDEAIRIATRAVQTFPSAVEPLRMETGVLSSAHRWDEALGAAREWRRRDSGEALDADLAIAHAELNLKDVSAASKQIEPYLDQAVKDPDKFSAVILIRAQGLLANQQPDEAEKLLGPLLKDSSRTRSVWVTLATRSVGDPQRAQAWLERVATVTPDQPLEKTTLANAWVIIGMRWNNPGYEKTGVAQLKALAQPSNAPTQTIMDLGMACEVTTDWHGAQDAYRRVLKNDPNNAIALNNLASVLLKDGDHLTEAQQLVTKAISLHPEVPNFLDTQASIQIARKDFPGAIKSLKEAKRLDPQNFEWRMNLLAAVLDGGGSGQIESVKAEMRQIEGLPGFAKISPEMRKRYDILREKLKQKPS